LSFYRVIGVQGYFTPIANIAQNRVMAKIESPSTAKFGLMMAMPEILAIS
jgi:hypothetical protein